MILKNIKDSLVTAVIFGLSSISGRAILFHCMLPNGAVFYRLPISAFFQKEFERKDVPDMRVDQLNCGTALVIILVSIVLIGWLV